MSGSPPTTWTLWPALGADGVSLVVYAEDGVTVIPAVTGASVPYTKFYTDLVYVSGALRTSNPLGTSGDPITIPPYLKVTGAQVGALTTSLATRATTLLGEKITTSGYRAINDGGDASFCSVAPATYTANGGTVINGDGCQWVMVWSGDRIDARAFGFRADIDVTVSGSNTQLVIDAAVAANTAALRAALAGMPVVSSIFSGGTVLVPAGELFVDSQVVVPWGVTLEGCAGSPLGAAASQFRYYGPDGVIAGPLSGEYTTVSVFAPRSNTILRNFGVAVEKGRIHSLVSYDSKASDPDILITHPCLEHLTLDCLSTVNVAEADHGITINTLEDAPGNIEMGSVVRVTISNPRVSHVRVGNRGAQPVNWVFTSCSFSQARASQVLGHSGGTPYGYCIENYNQNFSCTLNGPAINAVGIIILPAGGEFPCTINNTDSEYCKKLFLGGGYAYGTQPISVNGGRFGVVANPGKAAYDKDDQIIVAAADEDFISNQLSSPVVCRGVHFENNGTTSNFKIRVAFGGSITLDGCVMPTTTPITRNNAPFASEKCGGTYIRGSRGFTGPGVVDAIAERSGCENPITVTTISGANTTRAVVFPVAEMVVPVVMLVFVSESGGVAAAGSRMAWATNVTTAGFTLNVATAPGGAVVNTFAYRPEIPA